MERFQSGLFRKIVFVHMTQALVFSITGIVDSAFAGQFIGAELHVGLHRSCCSLGLILTYLT